MSTPYNMLGKGSAWCQLPGYIDYPPQLLSRLPWNSPDSEKYVSNLEVYD